MIAYNPIQNRRRYLRVNVPVYCRPARFISLRSPLFNIGLGGIRVYTDRTFRVGERLEIELFLPDYTSLTCNVRVVWLNPLPEDSAAKYDVCLQFLEVPNNILHRLDSVLMQNE